MELSQSFYLSLQKRIFFDSFFITFSCIHFIQQLIQLKYLYTYSTKTMSDIHSPSINSKSNSSKNQHQESNNGFFSPNLKFLMSEKTKVEGQLDDLIMVLESHNATMETPLVMPDGFPRADIDVHQVRIVRSQIIRLRNDLKKIMDDLQVALIEHHSKQAGNQTNGDVNNSTTSTNNTSDNNSSTTNNETTIVASYEQMTISESRTASGSSSDNSNIEPTSNVVFAMVREVATGGPAEKSGLLTGDGIIQFGSIDASNHNNLRALAPILQVNENKKVAITVKRNEEILSLDLIPEKNWGGRGLLGCFIVPA